VNIYLHKEENYLYIKKLSFTLISFSIKYNLGIQKVSFTVLFIKHILFYVSLSVCTTICTIIAK